MNPSTAGIRRRGILLLLVLVVTFGFGLYPYDYGFLNRVTLSEDGDALVYSRYGATFTGRVLGKEAGQMLSERGVTFRFLLGEPEKRQQGFALLLQIHAGDDREQLVVGRWSDQLIVMNGDDYDYRRRQPRLSARLPGGTNELTSLSIASDKQGTWIFLNGKLAASSSEVILRVPSSPLAGRIVLGNSVRGNQSWRGSIKEFQIYDKALSQEELLHDTDAQSRATNGIGEPGTADRLLVRCRMSTITNRFVPNPFSKDLQIAGLHVPKRRVVADPAVLRWPSRNQVEWRTGFLSDVVVNLLGFIPLGLALVWCGCSWGFFRRLITAVVVAAAVSLTIELLQAWMPSRSSSALDLTLNTLGGAFGALPGAWLLTSKTSGRPATSASPDSIPEGSSG